MQAGHRDLYWNGPEWNWLANNLRVAAALAEAVDGTRCAPVPGWHVVGKTDTEGNLVPLSARLLGEDCERYRFGVNRDDDFSEYVAVRWPRLVRSAVLLGCAHAEAEDLVQTTLERCLLQWNKVQRAYDRDAYVHRVLINTFTSSRRRRWTGEKPTAVLPDRPGHDDITGVDLTDTVVRALDQLTTDQRTAVVLRYYAHLSEEQMATVLGVATGTVKSRLSRALKNLAQDPQLEELRGTR